MNKMGKYIIKLRKEKNLTQQQLASKLGISNTAVSKWECGCNLPDISMIEPLSKVLDADILELISYLNSTTLTDQPSDTTDNKPNKYRLLFIITLTILLIANILIIISFTFIKVNAKRKSEDSEVKVYEMSAFDDKDFIINGYIIYNKNENIITINNILYQGDERGKYNSIKAQNIKINLEINNETIFNYESNNSLSQAFTINEMLEKINFDDKGYYNTEINLYDLESSFSNTTLKIECYEKDRMIYEYEQNILLLKDFIE